MIPSALRLATILSAFVILPALAQSPTPATPPTKPTPPTVTAPASPGATKDAAKTLLDINSASAEELGRLKGIGEVRSAAIVKGRPYKGKDELVQKKIIPEGVYAGIKDQIIAKQK